MFTVYLSNSLEKLKDELFFLLRDNPLPSPLAPEIIMVQSQGMQKWLSLKLSKKFGSWSSFKYLFPNNFLDEIFNAALGTPSGASKDPFSREEMSWLLMKILGRIAADSSPEFADLSKYLENDPDGLKRWQLAVRIANTFDQYLTFRPDYITAWEEGKNHPEAVLDNNDLEFFRNWRWQGKLWRSIKKHMNAKHRIERYHELLSAIQSKNLKKQNALPSRAIIFGIPVLPPLHVEVLSIISAVCPVHMFLLHPTKMHAEKGVPAKKKTPSASKSVNESPNPLLESLGSTGLGFLQELRNNKKIIIKSLFHEYTITNPPVLHALQHDILYNANTNYNHFTNADCSISLVSCHSPWREVEVLRDYLLDILNADDAPKLDEIIVMTPDIERYAPYIDAVFSSSDPLIPYTVSDRSPKGEHITIASFFALLDISPSRFEASTVLDLLEKKPIQNCLKITDEDLSTLRSWISDTRIRWGFDAEDKESFGLPTTAENTWKAGIDRMFLGFAMPEKSFFDGIVPYDQIEGISADLLGRISRFIHDLHVFNTLLLKPRSLSEWQKILAEWTARFFNTSDESNAQYQLIEDAVSTLSSISATIGDTQPVHFRVVRAYLESIIAENISAHNFLSGKLTFCAMLPMRSIPFKVICLIGMNDGIFPRQDSNIAFDLMSKKPRPGDRSLRNEDRYLFLEALISAKEKLFISYTGQSIVDSSEIPPSVVVSELIDYLHERISPSYCNALVIKHPLQPFSKRYFTGDGLFSYSKENFKTAQKLVLASRSKIPVFIDKEIGEPSLKDISLAELYAFLANPARHFLQRGLGLRFRREMDETEDDEPFFTDNLCGYQIKSMLLEDLLEENISNSIQEKSFQKYRSMGLLPHGRVGMVAFEQLHNETHSIIQKARDFLSEKLPSPIRIELKLPGPGIFLNGTLHHVYPKYQTIIRPARIRAKDLLKGWINHLALCALEGNNYPRTTVLIGSEPSSKHVRDIIILSAIDRHLAIEFLSTLVHLALKHEVEIFYFIPECSLAYFLAYTEKNDTEAAVQSAKAKWVSDFEKSFPEKNDPYQNLCFGNMDEEELFGERFHTSAIDIFRPVFVTMEKETS